MKKLFLIEVEPILKYPPVLSVINIVLQINRYKLYLCVTNLPESLKQFSEENGIEIIDYGHEFNENASNLTKFSEMLKIRRFMWNEINKHYEDGDILWVFSLQTLKHLGKELLKKKYVLHLFELIQEMYFLNKYKIGKFNLQKYCQNAYKVVVCEYNRAFITQAWFKLNTLPIVLQNKPYNLKQVVPKSLEGITNVDIVEKISKIKNKKIILYQGIIDEERPLDNFIFAVAKMGKEYEMVIMGDGSDVYEKINVDNLTCLPFIKPPFHLQITSYAHIGILSYIPSYNSCMSELNALYCAPNKIFEYSQFGIPMLGNNIPGLKYVLEHEQIGVCSDSFLEKDIIGAIKNIEKDYDKYRQNAYKYYESVDNKKVILEILD